jgi:hypothetical protein
MMMIPMARGKNPSSGPNLLQTESCRDVMPRKRPKAKKVRLQGPFFSSSWYFPSFLLGENPLPQMFLRTT